MLGRASVGQIKPSPNITIQFQTLATTAIQRSANGILCMIIKDAGVTSPGKIIIKRGNSLDDNYSEKNKQLILLSQQTFSPKKIIVIVMGVDETIATVLARIKPMKFDWLAVPQATQEEDIEVVTWIKGEFGTEAIARTTRYVSSFANNTDHVAIVELGNTGIFKSRLGDFTPQEYTVSIAGAIAGCPINRSLDNITFPDLIEVEDFEAKLGKFSFYNDDDKVRVNYSVNSKTTFDSFWKKDTRKIKVVEGMCQIVNDIRNTFKDYWLGIYINNYDNKMAFCSNITKVYFKELTPNILSEDYDNRIEVDYLSQEKQVIIDGLDPEEMSELEIRKYPTGDDVFLTGDVRFSDTMANLDLRILM